MCPSPLMSTFNAENAIVQKAALHSSNSLQLLFFLSTLYLFIESAILMKPFLYAANRKKKNFPPLVAQNIRIIVDERGIENDEDWT